MNKRWLAALYFLFMVCSSTAQAAEQTWTINLKDVNIRSFVEQVAGITGENYVVDPAVKGNVTVISNSPLTRAQVQELFLSVLRVHGYAAVASGVSTRIVEQGAVKQSDAGSEASSQQIVTRVLPVKNADVTELVRILKPLLSQNGYLEASGFSHSLIINDYGDHVKRITSMLKDLDRTESSGTDIIPLREAWVGSMIPQLEKLVPMEFGEQGAKSLRNVRVVADEHSNSVIIKGDKEERAELKALVEKLDQKSVNANGIHVILLHHADAKQVAGILTSLFTGKAQAASSSPKSGFTPNSSNTSNNASGNTSGSNTASSASGNNTSNSQALTSLFEPDSPEGNPNIYSANGTQISIQPDTALNALIIRAEPNEMGEISSVIDQLDVRRPQVLIEAAIVEISSTLAEQLGAQLAAGQFAVTGHGATNAYSNTGTVDATTILSQLGKGSASFANPAGFTGLIGQNNAFSLLVQALATTDGANLLSTPSITTLDNQEAEILVGQNVPFITGSYSVGTTASSTVNPFTTVDRQDVGITLKVLPQIHEGNLVRMDIEQEVSSISPTAVAGAADIITNKRRVKTSVLADDGQIIVLGGLIQDDDTKSTSGIPYLSDIPVVGNLFTSHSNSHTKENLLIFLRPTVLRSKDDVNALTQAKYQGMHEVKLGLTGEDPSGIPPLPPAASAPVEPLTQTPVQLPWLAH